MYNLQVFKDDVWKKIMRKTRKIDRATTPVTGINSTFLLLCISLLIEENGERKFTKSLMSIGYE